MLDPARARRKDATSLADIASIQNFWAAATRPSPDAKPLAVLRTTTGEKVQHGGGEIGGGPKGNRRRITKESDWRRKEVKTKGRMYAFYVNCGMGEEGSRHWRGRIRVGRYLPPRDTVLKRCRAAS